MVVKISVRKNLVSIVLGVISTLSLAGCDFDPYYNFDPYSIPSHKNNSIVQISSQHPTKSIFGRIVNIDEDNFAIAGGDNWRAGANFQYELIRIQDNEGNIKQLLSPIPTGYQVGDNINFNYRELLSITFSELLKQYGNSLCRRHSLCCEPLELQKGKITMDGLLLD